MITSDNNSGRDSQPSRLSRKPLAFSLRTRMIFFLFIITAITTLSLAAIYTYFRERTVGFLSDQLRTTVDNQAKQQLEVVSLQQSLTLDGLFSSVINDVSALSSYASELLANQATLGQGEYWDAHQKLSKLSQGQWDNPNSDVSSLLIPSSVELTDQTISEINTLVYLDLNAPQVLDANPIVVAVYFMAPQGYTIYYPNIDLAAIVGDYDPTTQAFYTLANQENNPDREVVWTAPYQDPAETGLLVTISAPVYDQEDVFRGVISADVQLAKLSEQISLVQIGKTGYALLVDNSGRILAMPEAGYKDFDLSPEVVPVSETPRNNILEKGSSKLRSVSYNMVLGNTGLEQVSIDDVERYFNYKPLPSIKFSFGIIVPVDEMNAPYIEARERIIEENANTQRTSLLFLGLALLGAFVISIFIGRTITNPLASLTNAAERFASGDLNVEAKVRTSDEIGALAQTFNLMTSRLREQFATLEQRVSERTRELTLAGEAGRALSEERDLDQLLNNAVNRIQNTFDLYYTQLYLMDPSERALTLRSGTGEVGAELLRRGHRLPIGPDSINGSAAVEKHSVIVSDTTESLIFRPNPLLPNTRSEMAVPLLVGDRVVGVLDMQSQIQGRLSEDNLPAFEALAGQLAIAVENASLFAQTQQARSELESQTRHITHEGWQEFLDAVERSERMGYIFEQSEFKPVETNLVDEDEKGENILRSDIQIIGETVGKIKLKRESENAWTPNDIELVNAVSGQIARQIENLRLLAQADRYRVEAENAARLLTREGWEKFFQEIPFEEIGFKYNGDQVTSETSRGKTDIKGFNQPLTLRGENIGELAFDGIEEIDEDTRGLISSIADRLTSHLDSLRLSAETQVALTETETLYSIIAEMNAAQSFDDILTALSSKTILAQANQFTLLGIFDSPLFGPSIPEWIYPVAYRTSFEINVPNRYPLATFQSTPGTLFTYDSVILTNNDKENHLEKLNTSIFMDSFKSKRSIVVPLILVDRSIGFVQGYYSDPIEFPEAEINRLKAVAGQAAIAVQSRLLLEQTKARALHEQRVREVTTQVFSATDIDTIMRRAVEQVGKVLGKQAYIYLGDKNDEPKPE